MFKIFAFTVFELDLQWLFAVGRVANQSIVQKLEKQAQVVVFVHKDPLVGFDTPLSLGQGGLTFTCHVHEIDPATSENHCQF